MSPTTFAKRVAEEGAVLMGHEITEIWRKVAHGVYEVPCSQCGQQITVMVAKANEFRSAAVTTTQPKRCGARTHKKEIGQ